MLEIFQNLKKDTSNWAKTVLKVLEKKSPTSMVVTFEQLKKSKAISLKECLSMEFRICQAMMSKHDFYEGVRANLVDKDKNPMWNPSDLNSVSNELVDEHFVGLDKKELF